jgi:hypothetical protein
LGKALARERKTDNIMPTKQDRKQRKTKVGKKKKEIKELKMEQKLSNHHPDPTCCSGDKLSMASRNCFGVGI